MRDFIVHKLSKPMLVMQILILYAAWILQYIILACKPETSAYFLMVLTLLSAGIGKSLHDSAEELDCELTVTGLHIMFYFMESILIFAVGATAIRDTSMSLEVAVLFLFTFIFSGVRLADTVVAGVKEIKFWQKAIIMSVSISLHIVLWYGLRFLMHAPAGDLDFTIAALPMYLLVISIVNFRGLLSEHER